MSEALVYESKELVITLVKSGIGNTYRHKATLRALGLRHLNDVVQLPDSPALRGMLRKVNHLVTMEEK